MSADQKNGYFVALNTVGKLGVTVGFCIIYFWCAEIYPTPLRNSLMGVSSMMARVGSIFAPVISDIVSHLEWWNSAVSLLYIVTDSIVLLNTVAPRPGLLE